MGRTGLTGSGGADRAWATVGNLRLFLMTQTLKRKKPADAMGCFPHTRWWEAGPPGRAHRQRDGGGRLIHEELR